MEVINHQNYLITSSVNNVCISRTVAITGSRSIQHYSNFLVCTSTHEPVLSFSNFTFCTYPILILCKTGQDSFVLCRKKNVNMCSLHTELWNASCVEIQLFCTTIIIIIQGTEHLTYLESSCISSSFLFYSIA